MPPHGQLAPPVLISIHAAVAALDPDRAGRHHRPFGLARRDLQPDRIAIAALGASSTAILISRLFLGNAPDFQVTVSAQAVTATGPLPYAVAATWPLFLALGVVAGIAASFYNRAILGALLLAARLDERCSVEVQAAAIGALVGIIGWFSPELIGGGDDITQRVLAASTALGAIPLAFVVRFGLGAACYAVRTPGGLFAPLLVLGAQSGLLFGALCQAAFPSLDIEPEASSSVWQRFSPASCRRR
jgi:chloride channel protein, CIC family